MNGNGNGKVYVLNFIHKSKYNFSELCFKGYKILRPENSKFFKMYFATFFLSLQVLPFILHFSVHTMPTDF